MGRSICAVVVSGLLAVLLVVPWAAAATPASFAAWHTRWLARSDAKVIALKARCAFKPNSSDLEAGTCIAKGSLALYPPLIAEWNREVAVIARGQSAPCRAAIHGYWLATAKNYAEALAFFRAHRHKPVTAITHDIGADRIQAIARKQVRATRRAVLVCG